MSTILRIGYMRLLRLLGRKSLISTSVFGFKYRISLGDSFSESQFYNPTTNAGEILACAAWVLNKLNPIIFDVGAHCGYIGTQLAELLREKIPTIYCFEPVAPTFSDLVLSINSLGLQKVINPVPIALSNQQGMIKLNYSKWDSMLAQIVPEGVQSNHRSGDQFYFAQSNTLDEVIDYLSIPDVIKIDVEGWEVPVLLGARITVLSPETSNTGICIEWNPEALKQAGFSPIQLNELLRDYRVFYINDYEGQLRKELEEIKDIMSLEHVCNLFAMRNHSEEVEDWKNNFYMLKAKYNL